MVWWLVFFMVLPVGVRNHHEEAQDPGLGSEAGAPVNPALGRKFIAASVAAIIVTGIYIVAVKFGGFSLRSLFAS